VENKIPDSPFLGSKIPDKMHFLAHLQEVSSGVTRRRNWIRRRRRRIRGSSRIEDLRRRRRSGKLSSSRRRILKRKKKQENCKVLWFLHLLAFGACVLGFLLSFVLLAALIFSSFFCNYCRKMSALRSFLWG